MTLKEKEHYLDMGFTKDQIEEICMGRDAGLDTSVYENKDFMTMQMHQIRMGLLEHLPVEIYAKIEYDWFQMEEIREGLKAGIDITVYASKEISYEKMHQIRKGLQEGINLVPYIELDASVMRELRKAITDGVNIEKYINEGYDADQLNVIRKALREGVNLDSYLSNVYRAASIAEICKGVKNGIDVSVYAMPQYTWRQMREIRLGLEHRLAIEKYSSRLYSWDQMKEIRLGLEQGLNVDGFRLLRYTADEMHKRRNALQMKSVPEQKEMLEKRVDSDDFRFKFSSDGMEVYVTVLLEDRVISEESLMKILEENSICRGIQNDVVERIVSGKYSKEPMLIAKGQPPCRGEDGWYEFLFRTNVKRKPKILENGSVDYQNVDWFETVQEGQKLAIYHPAKEGTDGYGVRGNTIYARKGTEKRVLAGKGFRIEDDNKTYISNIDGIISLDDNTMNISNHLELDEITMATGNITFNGSIHIRGDVGNGTTIKAKGDVVIDGTVEGAIIESSGSVVLKKGMNAASSGMIIAEKDVMSEFFETVKVEAKGNIDVNKCLNSQLYAEGMISSTKVIVGGVAQAEKGFEVKNVGNHAGIHTVLKIKINKKLMEEYRKTKDAVKDVKYELDMLNKYYQEFIEKFSPEERSGMEVFRKVEKAVYTQSKLLDQLKKVKSDIEQRIEKAKDAKIIIAGQAYEGTLIEMYDDSWVADNQRDIVISQCDGGIEVLSNL